MQSSVSGLPGRGAAAPITEAVDALPSLLRTLQSSILTFLRTSLQTKVPKEDGGLELPALRLVCPFLDMHVVLRRKAVRLGGPLQSGMTT